MAQQVHEGLRFLHRASAAASKGQSMEWLSDLSRLSGGERTLVSLAMILAVLRNIIVVKQNRLFFN